MVRLNSSRWALVRNTLNHIRVQSSLQEKLTRARFCFNFVCFLLKNVNESSTNNLSLFLGISHSFQQGQESILSIDTSKIDMTIISHPLQNLVRFILSQTTIIHQHCMESFTNSFGQQNCSHSRIYSSTYSTDDMSFRTDHGSHFLNEFVCIVTHNPILLRSCNVYDEVFEDIFTERRVCNFWVELKTPPSLGYVFDCYEISIGCSGHSLEPFRNLMQLISMTHPHNKFFW
mmetsp:Transcript_11691/g.17907  ORF Transcript_11691/g.17907 Transcript_11691/m.17907 type:complete len:231 (+) Transcript_11691:2354-3046(+)